jgi:oxygen-independent coproporphyrinogen-3 oxidase
LRQYEISNYAAPGAESRHNLAYWRYRDYAGIGPGAHGRLAFGSRLVATRRHRAPEIWAERVERDGHGSTAEEEVPPLDRAREALLMGLRLAEGVDRDAFEARTTIALEDAVDTGMLAACKEAGYLEDGQALRATAEGMRRLDAILPRLVR